MIGSKIFLREPLKQSQFLIFPIESKFLLSLTEICIVVVGPAD